MQYSNRPSPDPVKRVGGSTSLPRVSHTHGTNACSLPWYHVIGSLRCVIHSGNGEPVAGASADTWAATE